MKNIVKYTREEYRTEYLKSDEWKRLRNLILHTSPNCQCCNIKIASEVHHMTYRNIVDVKVTDLLPVCRPCHKFIHNAINDGYISQSSEKIEETTQKTLNILNDDNYKELKKWLSSKHLLSEKEKEIIRHDTKFFIIRRIAGITKSRIWVDDIDERKFTGRQLLKIRDVIQTVVYRRQKGLDKHVKLTGFGRKEYYKKLQKERLIS
jgi:hypothetical protein